MHAIAEQEGLGLELYNAILCLDTYHACLEQRMNHTHIRYDLT